MLGETSRVGNGYAITDMSGKHAVMTWLGDRHGERFQQHGVWLFNQNEPPILQSKHRNWRLV